MSIPVSPPSGLWAIRRPVAVASMWLATVLLAGLPLSAAHAAPGAAGGSAAGHAAPGWGWEWPVGSTEDPPVVVRRFQPPASPWLTGHRGVDLAAQPGTPVRASADGVVRYAGLLAGRGVVSVLHGELRTTYEPLVARVTAGERVARGQVVGVLAAGTSHCAAASCLHWGLLRGIHYQDPLRLVAAGPPRLLPLGVDATGDAPGAEAGSRGGVHAPAGHDLVQTADRAQRGGSDSGAGKDGPDIRRTGDGALVMLAAVIAGAGLVASLRTGRSRATTRRHRGR